MDRYLKPSVIVVCILIASIAFYTYQREDNNAEFDNVNMELGEDSQRSARNVSKVLPDFDQRNQHAVRVVTGSDAMDIATAREVFKTTELEIKEKVIQYNLVLDDPVSKERIASELEIIRLAHQRALLTKLKHDDL